MIKLLGMVVGTLVVYLLGARLVVAFHSSDIKADEQVVLFATAAHYDAAQSRWQVPIHGWIFDLEEDSLWRSALATAFVHGLNIHEDVAAQELFRRRARMFLVDNERNKKLTIDIAGKQVGLPKSGPNGHFTTTLSVADSDAQRHQRDGWMPLALVTPANDARSFQAQLQLVAEHGVSVISDIDDTVKHTNVRDKKAVIENTFVKPFAVVAGIEQAYTEWAKQGALFHYVSSSPWQLYPALTEFFAEVGLPAGSFYLKTFRVKDESFFDLFASPFETKVSTISGILERWPQRRFILVGDSGEKDPEVYARIYAQFPDQIVHIYIRNVTDEDGEAERCRQAFAGVPQERWTVFKDPSVLNERIDLTPGNSTLP